MISDNTVRLKEKQNVTVCLINYCLNKIKHFNYIHLESVSKYHNYYKTVYQLCITVMVNIVSKKLIKCFTFSATNLL